MGTRHFASPFPILHLPAPELPHLASPSHSIPEASVSSILPPQVLEQKNGMMEQWHAPCPACRVTREFSHTHEKGPVRRRNSTVVAVCLAKIGFYPLRSLADVETVSSWPTPQAGSKTRLPRMKQWLCSRGVWEMISRGSSSHDASGGCHWLFGTKRLTILVRHILVSCGFPQVAQWHRATPGLFSCGLGSQALTHRGQRNLDFYFCLCFWGNSERCSSSPDHLVLLVGLVDVVQFASVSHIRPAQPQ